MGYISAQDGDIGIPNLLVLRISTSTENKFYLGDVSVGDNGNHTAAILTGEDVKREEFAEIYQFNVEASNPWK